MAARDLVHGIGRTVGATVRRLHSLLRWSIAALVVGMPALPLWASETTVFTYDALGRLTNSLTTGSVNNNLTTATSFDATGNRINYTVTPNGAAIVTLTDSNLNVLASHTSTYSCSVTLLPPPISQYYRTCKVIATNYTVYSQVGAGAPTFDPGYSMTSNYTLLVTQAAYGTSVSP